MRAIGQRRTGLLQLLPQQRAIARETEIAGRGLQALQMAFQMTAAVGARRVHRFKQFEVVRQAGQETCLQPALGILVGRHAVVHDAGTDSEFARAHAIGSRRLQRQRADRHRQAKVADAAVARRRREPADRTGVQAARIGFQLADDLHGAPLRRAGDRAAGI